MVGTYSSVMAMRIDVVHSVLLCPPLLRSWSCRSARRIVLPVIVGVFLDLKKIKQGALQFYVLKRMNFMYIFWNKGEYTELRLFSMAEMLHYQLMSSLTSKVNAIIDQNQAYDPTINFGKTSVVTNLLQYALINGLNSIPTLFNAVPVLLFSNQVRSQISSILSVKEYKCDDLKASILMTMNAVVGISKHKEI